MEPLKEWCDNLAHEDDAKFSTGMNPMKCYCAWCEIERLEKALAHTERLLRESKKKGKV